MERIYVDMDNVLVDFNATMNKLSWIKKFLYENRLDEIPGVFSRMRPMEGAIEAVRKLSTKYDIYILSTPQWNNDSAWIDKIRWVKKYLGDVCYKRVIFTHNKSLCRGDYIIDDRGVNGTSEFDGVWLHYGSVEYPNWESILRFFGF